MSRELSGNQRRLTAFGALALFWGLLLAAVGIAPFVVVGLIVAVVAAVALGLEGRRLVAGGGPRLHSAAAALAARGRRADAWVAARGRRTGAAVARSSRAVSERVERVDWAGLRDGTRRRTQSAVASGRRGASAVGRQAAAGSRRAVAAGGAAAASLEARAREARAGREPQLGPGIEALKLNERAASLRQQGETDEALALGERALDLFRKLGDRHGEALTLNGLGLTQARCGDEVAAVDSYEKAVAILSELGDSHGAGRVLANLGSLHRGQGHDEQARAYLHHALEQLEPGTPEHHRTAEQLRLAG
jgi:tetratricopeptide (TPR) repeat protein